LLVIYLGIWSIYMCIHPTPLQCVDNHNLLFGLDDNSLKYISNILMTKLNFWLLFEECIKVPIYV